MIVDSSTNTNNFVDCGENIKHETIKEENTNGDILDISEMIETYNVV